MCGIVGYIGKQQASPVILEGLRRLEYRARGKEVWDDALQRVRSFQDDSKQYVRENPAKAVFTALGVGFVLGLILRR